MKKRRELNALIGLAADSRRKKPKKGASSHRLLRTEPPDSDTESSSEEEEDFGAAGNRSRFVRGDYSRCCKICYPLCAFVILAACVVACVGLVWMQVALKEDLDALKEKFRTRKWSPFPEHKLRLFARSKDKVVYAKLQILPHSGEVIIHSLSAFLCCSLSCPLANC